MDPASIPALAPRPLPYLARALRSAGYGIVIGVAIAYLHRQDLWRTLVYSLCISLLCWLCLDLGRTALTQATRAWRGQPWAARSETWPGWPWMLVIICVGCPIAYAGGTALGDLLTGQHTPNVFSQSSVREIASDLLFCIVPAVVITHYFYTRGALANREADARAAQQQAAQSRLKLLESQLEPHMLFNTLANLRVLIALDPQRAQAMLDQLIAFLRATLGGSRALEHPLREEFARLQDYLSLMRVRMGERLRIRFELPAALAEVPVPPLLLQPLVENSIKHGLEPAVGGGLIEVRAERDGTMLVLIVRDTGVGLSESAAVQAGFGVRQVRERLDALFGERASLTLEPALDADGGTRATVRLPLAAA
jgi:hypothetical protein